MAKTKILPITEELDFHMLLTLLKPLEDEEQFEWLPELFSIIGYERLIKLSKFAGGETIKIPDIDQLTTSMEALQWFYWVDISKRQVEHDIPYNLLPLVAKIREKYATDSQTGDR